MDRDAMEATRRHYDRHASEVRSKEQAMRERNRGLAMPLKKYHNQIKRELLQRFSREGRRLLDMACGRGGDINKWNDVGLRYVLGLDLSPNEIQEAQRRYMDTKKRRDFSGMQCEFRQTDELGIKSISWEESFDLVTCMFAAHYFHASEKSFVSFIQNVSGALRDGGYFIGTVPDGKRVLQFLNQKPSFTSPMLVLQARWEGGYRPFGSAYTCAITDTVTEGGQGSYEYLVFFSSFTAICKRFGLYPVEDYQCPELEGLLDPRDRSSAFKHFLPKFPGSPPGLETASALNCTFVFQKRNCTPTVPSEEMTKPKLTSKLNPEEGLGKRKRTEATEDASSSRQEETDNKEANPTTEGA